MRLLHTSDWHLGQTFYGQERYYEHEQFLSWLLDTLVVEQIDVLLIAGDVFDQHSPPGEAQLRYYRFLAAAIKRQPLLQVVVTAGNHDSGMRLEAPRAILDHLRITVVGRVRHPGHPHDVSKLLVPLYDADEAVALWCMAMPFLRLDDLPLRKEVTEDTSDPYTAGVRALHAAVFAEAQQRLQPGQGIIAMGHCFMRGGEASCDSERRLHIGGADTLPVDIFPPEVAYVALGHLHRAQKVGGQAHIRYSGSPLPMSFSEIHYTHQVVKVTVEAGAVQDIRSIPIPRTVDLWEVPAGRPAPLAEALALLTERLANQEPSPSGAQNSVTLPKTWPYLRVRLSAEEMALDARARIEAILEGQPVRLVQVERERMQVSEETFDIDKPLSIGEAAIDPITLFTALHRQKCGKTDPSPALLRAFQELLSACEDDGR